MNGIRRLAGRISLGMVLLLLLAGCQKKEPDVQETGQTEKGTFVSGELQKDYEATFLKLEASKTAAVYRVRTYGEKVFYLDYDETLEVWYVRRVDATNGKNANVIRWSEEEAAAGKWGAKGAEGGKWSVQAFDLTKDGNLLTLLGRYDGEDQNAIGTAKEYVLAEYDLDGNKKSSLSLEADVFPPQSFSFRLGVDGRGNVAIQTGETIILVADGKKKGEIRLEDGAALTEFARSTEGSLYVSVFSGGTNRVCRINFDTCELEPTDGIPTHYGTIGEIADGVPEGHDNALLLSDYEGLYLADLTQKKTYKITDWEACGIRGAEVYGVNMRGERAYVYALSQTLACELAVLTPKKEGEAVKSEGPTVIRLAVLGKTTILSNIVSGYNRSQKKYRVEMVDYSKGVDGIYGEDFVERMVADVLGENPPDLLDMTNFFNRSNPSVEDFLDQSYVDDLTPYLEKSEKICREDFLEKVMEMVTFEKGMPAIPSTVMIDTMIVSKTEFGERMGWTIDEFIAYDKTHPENPPKDHCSRGDFIFIWIYPNLEYFVDFENKNARFDSPAFRKMLEYAHAYPVGDGIDYPYSIDQFLHQVYLESVFDVQMIRNRYFQKSAEFVGYPSVDGKPLFFLNPDINGVAPAICSRSRNKEGAWDFIEYALSQNPITTKYTDVYAGIPSNKKFLQENVEVLADVDGPLKSGAYPLAGIPQTTYNPIEPDESTWYVLYPFTEEEEEILFSLLNGVTVRDPRIHKVWSIIYPELNDYFSDQKTLDQVIDVIQNRVRLFLKEQ